MNIKFLISVFSIALFINQSTYSQTTEYPKNIIILIGDGMGTTAVSYSTLSNSNSAFYRFTNIGFSKTQSEQFITDSGAGGTALATGYRTKNKRIGVSANNDELKNIMEYAYEMGKKTGIVATSTITHATPASFVTHVYNRNDEETIADQFVTSNISLAIGGGLKYFNSVNKGGSRKDGKNYVDTLKNKGFNVCLNYDSLDNYSKKSSKLFAILEFDALKKAIERKYTLANLTHAALNVLSNNNNGFVLMVEGSQIDWAAHKNSDDYWKGEISDFDKAIHTALDFAEKDKNTLVIVIADHETGGAALTEGTLNTDKIDVKFRLIDHSSTMVAVFSYGPGMEQFRGIQDNNIIARKLIELVVKKKIEWEK